MTKFIHLHKVYQLQSTEQNKVSFIKPLVFFLQQVVMGLRPIPMVIRVFGIEDFELERL